MISREAAGYLLGLIGVTIFAGTLPATRLAVQGLDPWFVTFGRGALAGVCGAAVLLVLRRPRPNRQQMKYLLAAAPNVVFTFPLLIGLAMQTLPASHGGVVLGLLPLLTAACGALFKRTRLPLAFWGLSALAAVIVIGFSVREGGGSLAWGDALLLLAAICAAFGYVASAEASRTMPGWEVISWIVAFCLPLTLPLMVLFWPQEIGRVTTASWLGFAYAGLFSQFIGFFAWNAGLVLGGVAGVSQVQYLQTFITIGIAALVNREAVGWDTLAVALLIVAVLVLGRRSLAR